MATEHPFERCFRRCDLLANDEPYRLSLAQRFSYVLPDQHLIEVIQRYSPIVEIGAGTGYWAYVLACAGADVIAYDIAPLGGARENRYHQDVRPWTTVAAGDVEVLKSHASRSLLVCWPPRFSNMWEVVDYYAGKHVLYIGDGGMRTAALAGLNQCFDLVESYPVVAMDPAPGTEARLSIWRRVISDSGSLI